MTTEELVRAAVARAQDEEQRAAKFNFDRLELEYRGGQMRGISQTAVGVLQALVKEERPRPVREGQREYRP